MSRAQFQYFGAHSPTEIFFVLRPVSDCQISGGVKIAASLSVTFSPIEPFYVRQMSLRDPGGNSG
jgi:hypothetical protein